MKEMWEKFIKDKFNIALIIVQAVALLCLALTNVAGVFVYFFVILEGAFFVVWGIKGMIQSKNYLKMAEQYEDLPMTTEQKVYYRKRDIMNFKNTRFRAVMMIIIGVVVFCLIFSL